MTEHEVPFRLTISGTLILSAENELKAQEAAAKLLNFDPEAFEESEILWTSDDNSELRLKDSVRGSLELLNATAPPSEPKASDPFDSKQVKAEQRSPSVGTNNPSATTPRPPTQPVVPPRPPTTPPKR